MGWWWVRVDARTTVIDGEHTRVPSTQSPGLRRKFHCSPFGKEKSFQLIVAL